MLGTGKSMSEALIFASTNPQYDDRLFIDLQVQYMKTTSSELGENMFYHVLPMYWTGKSMNNLLSYRGLVDVRISASEIDLPVKRTTSVFIGTLEMYCPQMNNEDGCHVKFACWINLALYGKFISEGFRLAT